MASKGAKSANEKKFQTPKGEKLMEENKENPKVDDAVQKSIEENIDKPTVKKNKKAKKGTKKASDKIENLVEKTEKPAEKPVEKNKKTTEKKEVKSKEEKKIDQDKKSKEKPKKTEKEDAAKITEVPAVGKTKKPAKKPDSDTDEDSSDEDEMDEESESLSSDLVVTKYAAAANIANEALKVVLGAIKEGAEVGDLCDTGDKVIEELAAKVFKKDKELQKGIASPTCISINNCICCFSPLRSDAPILLQVGQMVKVELGAHIDGFISTVAHTVVVGASEENKIKGKQAHVIMSAYTTLEAIIRMLQANQHKNIEITDMIDKFADIYSVKPVEGIVSHQLERNKLEGEKQIVQNPGEKKSDITKCTFEKFEAYAIDVIMSTGEGKKRLGGARSTVFRKTNDGVYNLRIRAARNVFSHAVNKYGSMAFTLRAFADESQSKIGLFECERHKLLQPYQVYYEKEGEYVAQFKATVLLLANGVVRISGLPLDMSIIDCNIKVKDKELIDLLNTPLKLTNKKKKRSKKNKKGAMKNDDDGTQKKDQVGKDKVTKKTKETAKESKETTQKSKETTQKSKETTQKSKETVEKSKETVDKSNEVVEKSKEPAKKTEGKKKKKPNANVKKEENLSLLGKDVVKHLDSVELGKAASVDKSKGKSGKKKKSNE